MTRRKNGWSGGLVRYELHTTPGFVLDDFEKDLQDASLWTDIEALDSHTPPRTGS